MESFLIALLCLVVLAAVWIGAVYLMVWAAMACLVAILMVLETVFTGVSASRQVDVTIRHEAMGSPRARGRVEERPRCTKKLGARRASRW
jgi:hypothetical protein